MRIIHSGSCNILAGGPALSTWLTIKGLREHGVDASIVMQPIIKGKLISDELHPTFSRPSKYQSLAYVPGFSKTLESMGAADIYHGQGVWMLHTTQMAHFAKKHKKPYVITLRGMLYPQSLAHNPLLKKISMMAYQRATLRDAAAVQATCIEELEHYRALGFTNPVAVIQNPIEVKEDIELAPAMSKSIFRIGYLGRIHPRKRVERLIYAINNLKNQLPSDSELLIIGGGDDKYETFLREETKRLNLNNVKFAGFLSGDEKSKAINSLSLLVVPSDFENFGNIVTEALVHGVPVAASKGMPWSELEDNNCGWWIKNDQETIDKTIINAFNLGQDRLWEMGQNGRQLMITNYSVSALGEKMHQLYKWILGEIEKPVFVYTT